MSVRVIWSVMFFITFFCWIFFVLGNLVIVESGLLKPPTIIVLPISPLSCVSTSFIYLNIPMMSIDIYNCYILLMNSPVYRYTMTFLSPVMDFDWQSILSDMSIVASAVFWLSFAWTIFWHPFTFSLVSFVFFILWLSWRLHKTSYNCKTLF